MTTLGPEDHVVVVGAGLAGWKFCEEARRLGFAGEITLIGDEVHAPYDRPPLSKQILVGKWGADHSTLATPDKVADLDVTMRLGARAIGLDLSTMSVQNSDGTQVTGTHIVIATGARARRLNVSADADTHVVRSRDDVIGLVNAIAHLGDGDSVAVVGGGFIGAEVATQLHQRGLHPVVLEAAARPLHAALGEVVAQWLEPLASDAGIELRSRVQVADIVRRAGGFAVQLAEGDSFDAALVVVGVGAVPNDDWLSTSGLVIDGGVVVDSMMMASERVAAIGDVARFEWHSVAGTEMVRIEHWQVANDHAVHLARHWVTGATHDDLLIPYFWSDQYGKKIQLLGHPGRDDQVLRVKDSGAGQWLALYHREGVVTGVIGLSQPRAVMLSHGLLEVPTGLEEALRLAPWG